MGEFAITVVDLILDAFMGWPSSLVPALAVAKMVEGKRGGWCYEMNGLFGASLAAPGFRATRLCGGVNREMVGNLATDNPLTLRVDLNRPYLTEVDLVDTIIQPIADSDGGPRRGGRQDILASATRKLNFKQSPLTG